MSEPFYTAWMEVVPDFSGFSKKFDSELNGVVAPAGQKAGKKAGDDAGKGMMGGVIGAVGRMAGPLAIAFAGLQVGQMVASTISDGIAQAADLEQSVGAIATVFKGGADEMLAWSDQAATSVGLTKNEFNELGTLIGSQLKNGGTAMDDLAPKTNSLIQLGADLSSMFGGSTSEAVEALSSALKGERDPIERYGVSLTQAAIDAKAAELGFAKVGGALSAEASQAATLALIMDQTADAHGNFASETDTLAHQQQVLAAGWDNVVTQIGQLFLPLMTTIVGFLNTSVIPALSGFFGALNGGDGAASGFGSILGTIGDLFGPILSAVAPLVGELLQLWTTASPIMILFQALQPVIPIIAAALGQLASVLGTGLGVVLQAIVPIITQLVTILSGIFQQVVVGLMPLIMMLAEVFGQIVTALAPLIAAIFQLIAPLVGLLAPTLQVLMPILQAIIDLFIAVLGPVLQLVQVIIDALMPVIQALIDILTGLITFVVGVFSGDWEMAWSGVEQIFNGFVSAVKGIIEGLFQILGGIVDFIFNLFGGVGDWLVDAGQSLIQGFIDGISSMVGQVGDAIGGIMDWVGGFFPHSPAKRGPFSGSGWTSVADGGRSLAAQFAGGFDDGMGGFGLGSGPLGPRLSVPGPIPVDDVLATSPAGAGGGAGDGPTITIFNPVPERASTSIQKTYSKIAYLGLDAMEGADA